MNKLLNKIICDVLEKLKMPKVDFSIQIPKEKSHGDVATNIAFDITRRGNAHLSIYNMNGENVWEVKMPGLVAGNYTVSWNGRNMSGSKLESGVYIYRLTMNEMSQSRKLLLIK